MSRGPVYLILAHQDPAHLRRLVLRLGRPALIHVDAKVELSPFSAALADVDAVLIADREKVAWGGWSVVEATKALIREALRRGMGVDATHFVLLSGADYPLAACAALNNFFRQYSGYQLISYADCRVSAHRLWQLERRHLFDRFPIRQHGMRRIVYGTARQILQRGSKLFPKVLPSDVRFVYGSQWWALTPACAEACCLQSKTSAALESILRTALAPDEFYFHSMVANLAFSTREPFGPRDSDFLPDLAPLHHIHPSLTKLYGIDDIVEISSSTKLFVRKVSTDTSAELLDKLDQVAEGLLNEKG